jgi:rubredoxin
VQKYVCSVCGYVYDETIGDPEAGIAPGTKWDDVPEDWICPWCGATKSEFNVQGEQKEGDRHIDEQVTLVDEINIEETHELSFGELSALCSNLSKGCEKQYLTEEAALFQKLSDYYKSKTKPVEGSSFEKLKSLVQEDLNIRFVQANRVATDEKDRGALRALTWSEKVTKILNSLLLRYENQKDSLLEDSNFYLCEICGFVFIGEEAPDICPVCKVPRLKIAQVQRR